MEDARLVEILHDIFFENIKCLRQCLLLDLSLNFNKSSTTNFLHLESLTFIWIRTPCASQFGYVIYYFEVY